MSEMIERVAKAIETIFVEYKGDASDRFLSTMAARAAIEAIREPTEEMRAASIAGIEIETDYGPYEIMNTWHAMIDAALGIRGGE